MSVGIAPALKGSRVIVEGVEERFPEILGLVVLERDSDRFGIRLVGEGLTNAVNMPVAERPGRIWGGETVVERHHLVGLPAAVRAIENLGAVVAVATEGVTEIDERLPKSLGHQRPIEEGGRFSLELVLVADVVEFDLAVDLAFLTEFPAYRDRIGDRSGERLCARHQLIP
ncbi:hypothetical protein [Halococcus sp. IIIV-5B]|uniref:hypothetical protein n=1 Tax=Halococcus sp. IIIV-5B TaxID=2321230 RepID=UPI001F3EB937|nr:hypothetical protein [Halococcus sp. IIIV-5B]